jgi:hypothetical protein
MNAGTWGSAHKFIDLLRLQQVSNACFMLLLLAGYYSKTIEGVLDKIEVLYLISLIAQKVEGLQCLSKE